MLNCLIVDDEPLARQQIAAYVGRVPFLRLVGTARNAELAQDILERQAVDLIFLDIQMPKQTGIAFLRSGNIFQQVIFITAYPEHAVAGFELEVTDYLLKPVTFERFLKACEKAWTKVGGHDGLRSLKDQLDFIYVKCEQRFEKVLLVDILYIEAMLNYVQLITHSGKYIVHSSLKAFEALLPEKQFIRIHKSFIVAIAHIDGFDQQLVRIGGRQLTVSRNKRSALTLIFLG